MGAPLEASSSGWACTESRQRSAIPETYRALSRAAPQGPGRCVTSGPMRASRRPPTLLLALLAVTVMAVVAAGCGTSGRTLRDPEPGATAPPRKGAATTSTTAAGAVHDRARRRAGDLVDGVDRRGRDPDALQLRRRRGLPAADHLGGTRGHRRGGPRGHRPGRRRPRPLGGGRHPAGRTELPAGGPPRRRHRGPEHERRGGLAGPLPSVRGDPHLRLHGLRAHRGRPASAPARPRTSSTPRSRPRAAPRR